MSSEFYSKAADLAGHGKSFAVATVVRVEGSSSAKQGSKAIIDSQGKIVLGWVGGGCAESAVRNEALKCIELQTSELITLDMVDELLAKHYGIPNVSGNNFRRVQIPDKNRRGILGQASILTLTSVSTRTSPVARGKYVMEVLLGTPPPPPPPSVPPLKENSVSGDTKVLSVRERMEEHRKVEPCASCHKLMDPIGFALDNFDAVGSWRINDGGLRIDANGQLFDGSKLDGPASVNQAILKHSDMFLSAFGENQFGMAPILHAAFSLSQSHLRHLVD